MGTPDEARERIDALERQGTQRIMLQDFLPRDLDMFALHGPHLRGLTAAAGRRPSCATLPRSGTGPTHPATTVLIDAPTRASEPARDAHSGLQRIGGAECLTTSSSWRRSPPVGGIVIGFLARRFLSGDRVKHAESYAERLMAEARAKQKEIVLEGKDEALQVQRAAEEEAREKRADLQRSGAPTPRPGGGARSQGGGVRAARGGARGAAARARRRAGARWRELQQRQLVELERVSGPDRVRGARGADPARSWTRRRPRHSSASARSSATRVEEGEDRARRVLTTVMQRIAADHTSEATDHGRAAAERGDEGPHHRPRGPQHPRPGAGDRRRPDHRRHARGGRPVRLRPGAPRGGAHGAAPS